MAFFACEIGARPKICKALKDKFASRADDSIKNELARKLGVLCGARAGKYIQTKQIRQLLRERQQTAI